MDKLGTGTAPNVRLLCQSRLFICATQKLKYINKITIIKKCCLQVNMLGLRATGCKGMLRAAAAAGTSAERRHLAARFTMPACRQE